MNQPLKILALPVIDQYLKDGLLENLGEDEQRYHYLGETVTSLLTRIKEDPRFIINFSLVAFQPKPSVDESEITLVYEILKEYWRLIDNIYRQDRPIVLIKAIMLETISRLCDHDGRLASIVYHANTSAVLHYKYDQKEGPLIKQILAAAAIKAEEFAASYYVSLTEVKEKLDFEIDTSEAISIDRKYLHNRLMAAVGPCDENSSPLSQPHNAQQVIPPPYNKVFADIASESIAQLIESSIEDALSEFANDISNKFQEVAVYNNNFRTSNLEIETKVLWWMQSLYSPKLQSTIVRTELSGYDAVGAQVFIAWMRFNQSWVQV